MKKKYRLLIVLFITLLSGYFVLENSKAITYTKDYEIKLAASRQAAECFKHIKKLKNEKNIYINGSSDINNTGMIGPDYSEITTTLGDPEAKRTSANPNMSAVIVDMLHELRLQPGDQVAVNFSGSFPALNIAAICAVEQMGLEPIIMSSFGASAHGANDPDLTYLDMENYLYSAGLIHSRSAYFSVGGFHDIGKEMDPAMKEIIIERLRSYGYPFLCEEDLEQNINKRFKLYTLNNDIKCFINVGGNDVSFGYSDMMVYMDGGIIYAPPRNDDTAGLVQLFLKKNKPVIHLLNIKKLAAEYGLPVDPAPVPPAGEGGVYYTYGYNKVIAAILLIITSLLMYVIYRTNKEYK